MVFSSTSKVCGVILSALILIQAAFAADTHFLPEVKQHNLANDTLAPCRFAVNCNDCRLDNEVFILKEILEKLLLSPNGDKHKTIPIHLQLNPIPLPIRESDYRQDLINQGYELAINEESITISAHQPEGVFYGIQTLRQLIENKTDSIPCGTILDWPDLPIRMIMLDLARQMEHPDYISRVIDFCARNKFNGLHLHLSDDQNLCLHHEDYPSIQHPRALREKTVQQLVEQAARYHINIIPEIESLGHSRLFIRHPKAGEILHQAPNKKTVHAIPGYTNVLCPASPLTHKFLDDMYERCAELFPYETIHIGCDEVHLTGCKRCDQKFPDTTPEQRFMNHLQQCADHAAKHGKTIGIWDDMFWHTWRDTTLDISMDDLVRQLPVNSTTIYSWHYYDVPEEIPARFKKHGYNVIACPSLLCWGHMVFPDPKRFKNVREFAEIARRNDLQGLDATIWLPQRYLTNTMWAGIAYTADQAWAGSNTSEESFFSAFLEQFYGSPKGKEYDRLWKELDEVQFLKQALLHKAIWSDAEGLTVAADLAEKKQAQFSKDLQLLQSAIEQAENLTPSITKHKTEWASFIHGLKIVAWSIEHVLAAPAILKQQEGYTQTLKKLDNTCQNAIPWVDQDWNRNRYEDDLMGKDNASNLAAHHLLFSLKQAHRYHQEILKDSGELKTSTQN